MGLHASLTAVLSIVLFCSLSANATNDEYFESQSEPKCHDFQGNCYLLSINSQNRMSYYDGEDYCRERGAHLVSILSKEENDFLMETLNTKIYYYGRIWIGLNTLQGPNQFQWSDESPVSFKNIIDKTQYKKESCYILYGKEGGWRPEHCSLHYTPICKRPSDALPSPLPPMTTPAIQGHCSPDWIQYGQKCYKYFGAEEDQKMKFKEAQKACLSLGEDYDLASIHSAEEQAFLIQNMEELGTSPWIGFRYVESDEIGHEMVFGWTDNSRTDVTFWAPGHPLRGTWKYCTRLNYEAVGKGEWISDYCDIGKHGYICQGPPSPSNPPPTPKPNTCEQKYVGFRDSCYRYFSERITWDQAEETCQEQGGHLVSVLDGFEEYFLYSFIGQLSESVWLGLSTVQDTRILGWSDKQPVYYANWAQDQPLILDAKSPQCTFLSKAGILEWNITECATRQPFICKVTKVDPKPLPPVVMGECPSTEPTWIDIGDNYCYHVPQRDNRFNTWGDGSRYCISKGMEMISTHSEHRMSTLLPYLWKSKYNLWLGLIRSFNTEVFMWVDGSALEYTNWADGEPSKMSKSSKKDCVTVSMRDSKWYPTECRDWAENICRVKKSVKASSAGAIRPAEGGIAELIERSAHLVRPERSVDLVLPERSAAQIIAKSVSSVRSEGEPFGVAAAISGSQVIDRNNSRLVAAPSRQTEDKDTSDVDPATILTATIGCVAFCALIVSSVFYYMRRKENKRFLESLTMQRFENTPESTVEMEETLPKY